MYKVQSLSAPVRRSGASKPRQSRTRVSRAVAPVIDTLESRTLFSSVSLSNGILSVIGSTTAGNSLTVSTANSGKTINASNGSGATGSYSTSSVKGISIVGGSGADTIYEDSAITIPTTIKSGDGNDTVRTGGGVNSVTTGNGNDWVNTRGTANTLTAGNGNDTVLAQNADTITLGNGNSTITGGRYITVGNGNNVITSGSGNDSITAGNGKDSINGGLGSDTMVVGTGLDTLYGGSGANVMIIGNTNDVIPDGNGTNKVTLTSGTVVSNPSNGSTSTPSTVAGSTSWVKYTAAKSSDSTAPQAVMEVLAPALTVGIAVDFRAVASVVGTGSPITTNYQWNFGDTGGQYNTLDGYNASHIYQTAGTYTAKLTITNSANKVSTVTVTLKIAPDERKKIYVDSVSGNDSNAGTINAPLKTAAEADTKVGNDTEILFKRGDTFLMPDTFKVTATDVMVDSYGSGALPIMEQPADVSGNAVLFSTWTNNYGMTIQNLTFSAQKPSNGVPFAVVPRGVDETVRDCTFANVEYGINGNGDPSGFNLIGSSSPNMTGLNAYLFWVQGTDITVIGNSAVNSNLEHILRSSSANDLLIADNNFKNEDGKGAIEVHVGSYAWVVGNTVTDADIRVGPLGLWGEAITDITQYATVEDNMVVDSSINIDPGAHDVSVRNNIIKQNTDTQLININSLDGLGRYVTDVQILNNTGISSYAFGQFIKLDNAASKIVVDNNLLVEPTLTVGAYTSAPICVATTDMSSFTQITGNVWQAPKTNLLVYAGINMLNSTYLTASQWNALSVVGTDFFASTSLNSNYSPVSGSLAATADSPLAGNFTDYYGTTRSTSGKWAAGAV